MKELIGIAILIFGLYGTTWLMKPIFENIRKAALEKAGNGLPPLPRYIPK